MKYCLGTAQFGYPYGLNKKYYTNIDDKFNKIINWNKKNQFFDYIDTASNYGNAEKIIGKNLYKNHQIKVISKFSSQSNSHNIRSLIENLNRSLESLKIKKFYGILVHDKSLFYKDKVSTTIKFLNYIKKNKLSQKIGISVYTRKELEKNAKYFNFDLIQIPINIFDQSFSSDNYLKNISKKYEIFVRSIFLQGLLLDKNNKMYFKKYNNELIKYDNFLKDNNLKPLEACIGYIYSLNLKLKIVFGVNSVDNVEEIHSVVKKLNIRKIKKINFSQLKSDKKKLTNPYYWKV
tara:strand:+ start:1332 stop:2204 length:873 start_codon:yes stop_codon:yes gene_type:complete